MNTPVSFEIAKLLKEKGFDKRVKGFYDTEKELHENYVDEMNTKGFANRHLPKGEYSAPTIAEVVMWLHKEKGLWVNVMYMGFELKYSWSIDIITTSGSDWDSYGEEGDICYKSPTEAYESAITYTLNNLI